MNKVDQTKINAHTRLDKLKDLFAAKLNDYGTDDLKIPEQILQRLEEKIGRIRRLQLLAASGGTNQVSDEKIEDTADDILGYGLILTLMLHGEWGQNQSVIDEFVPPVDVGGEDRVLALNDWLLTKHEQTAFGHKGISEPKKDGDCGYDLLVAEDFEIKPNHGFPVDIPCGVSVKVPDGYFALIINRSSTSRKFGLWVVPGLIDPGYTGQLFTCVYNMTSEVISIKKGDRLAQLILLPTNTPAMKEVKELPTTERGTTGFGSTGI